MLLVTAKALPGHRHSRIFQVFSALEKVRLSRQRTEVDINENQGTVFALKHEQNNRAKACGTEMRRGRCC
jgi:hypothetical protein